MLKKKSIIISVIFTFALVAFLISYISLNDILTSLSKLSLSFVLLALFFYFLSYLFRTSRFLIFLNND